MLDVADNGPGIPASGARRVFERFYRVTGTGESGSGLGLSIVKPDRRAARRGVALDDRARRARSARRRCALRGTMLTG